VLQCRNAFELGGFYFSANLVLSQVSVAACALLYHTYYEEDEVVAVRPNNTTFTNSTGTKFTEEQLLVSTGTLFGIFVLSFTLFMFKIERKYAMTFFSAETGHAKAKRSFLSGADDFAKSQILRRQKRQWNSIRPQVKRWLDENWDKWERDKPDWFNALFIASVDDDIMPARAKAAEEQKAGGGSRRRSSLLEKLSVRLEEPKDDSSSSSSSSESDTD
jgi:hypothetical protein